MAQVMDLPLNNIPILGNYAVRVWQCQTPASGMLFSCNSLNVLYETETELLTVFWRSPRKNQIITELGDEVILIKDATTGEPIGVEILSSHPGDIVLIPLALNLGN